MCTLLQQICGSVEQVGSLRTTFPRASAHACSTFQSGGRTSRRNYTSDCGQRKNHCPKIDAPRFPENKCVQYIPLRQHERIVHARQQVAEDARASPKKNKKHLTSCHNHNCLRSGGGGKNTVWISNKGVIKTLCLLLLHPCSRHWECLHTMPLRCP